MKSSLFLVVLCFLTACNDRSTEVENRLDKLQKEMASMAATQTENIGNNDLGHLYLLVDMARNSQVMCVLFSARPINTGEVVRVGDDLWTVRAVQVFTDHTNPPVAKVKEHNWPGYELVYTELVVQFAGKAQTAPETSK